jgi:hypothetical protein
MNANPYRVVSVTELQTMLEAKDFIMVNVHTPWEGDIPQTDLRLAYDCLKKIPASSRRRRMRRY